MFPYLLYFNDIYIFYIQSVKRIHSFRSITISFVEKLKGNLKRSTNLSVSATHINIPFLISVTYRI